MLAAASSIVFPCLLATFVAVVVGRGAAAAARFSVADDTYVSFENKTARR
jgi:hypothetical protein